MPDVDLKLGKQRVSIPVEQRTAVLCGDAAQAHRVVAALAGTGIRAAAPTDSMRGRLGDQLRRGADAERLPRILRELQLDDAVLDWRMRELTPLQRMVATSIVAAGQGADTVAFDVAALSASPFDVAHACGHIRRMAEALGITCIAVIADAALISSAGTHLVVMEADTLGAAGSVADLLAHPPTRSLEQRLQATPIASPMAMQMRRVQRTAEQPVNYAHTTIIQWTTEESIALAGGDAEL